MPGYEEVLFAYRERDPERATVGPTRIAGRCVSCGGAVYVKESAFRTLREHDPVLCCRQCQDRYDDQITEAL